MNIRKGQLDRVQIVTLSDQKILPAIVVVIKKTHTPAGMLQGHASDSGRIAVVSEGAVAIVAIKRVHLIC